jgi:Zn-dependent protease
MSTHAIRSVPSFRPPEAARASGTEPRGRREWAWRIGRIAGIEIYVHATFVLLVGWVALSHLLYGQGALHALSGVLLMLAVFAVVVLHELGHALVARRFGIRTQDITLLPIGGVARFDRIPDEPVQELLVALAGPAVNVALAALLGGAAALLDGPLGLDAVASASSPFLTKLMWINVSLAVFNLVPAFPMDGGRVARALFAMRMDYVRATDLAARLGQGFAVLFGLVGVFLNPLLVLIALFVWIGAQQEAGLVHARSSLHGVTVRQAMITDYRVLSADETVGHALEHALAGFQEDFPVVQDDRVVGLLRHIDLLRAMAAGELEVPVERVMKRDVPVADETEPVVLAAERFREDDRHAIPVVRDGALVGHADRRADRRAPFDEGAGRPHRAPHRAGVRPTPRIPTTPTSPTARRRRRATRAPRRMTSARSPARTRAARTSSAPTRTPSPAVAPSRSPAASTTSSISPTPTASASTAIS